MKKKIEIIFQHGWGFDSSAWEGWITHLQQSPDVETTVQIADRGYFGKENPVLGFAVPDAAHIVVAHSLGIHLLPPQVVSQASLVVAIGAFLSFHSGDPLSQRRSKRTLRLMRERLDNEPMAVLDDFFGNCYKPLATRQLLVHKRTPGRLAVRRLVEDLDTLNNAELDASLLSKAGQVLILHGTEDHVVPAAQAHELNMTVPASHLIMFEGAGHALPLTHVAPCWLSVHNALNAIAPIGLH